MLQMISTPFAFFRGVFLFELSYICISFFYFLQICSYNNVHLNISGQNDCVYQSEVVISTCSANSFFVRTLHIILFKLFFSTSREET